jgi:hypothetical protein
MEVPAPSILCPEHSTSYTYARVRVQFLSSEVLFIHFGIYKRKYYSPLSVLMRDVSCKNQFETHKIFSPRFSMPKRNIHYTKYGETMRPTPRANTVCNYMCRTARLNVFTDKLLGGVKDIVQIYVLNVLEYLNDIVKKAFAYFCCIKLNIWKYSKNKIGANILHMIDLDYDMLLE